MKLVGNPRAVEFRRHLAIVDVVVIALLVIGVEERVSGSARRGNPLSAPAGGYMLVVFSCIVLWRVLGYTSSQEYALML